MPQYARVLIKLSGEVLTGGSSSGLDAATLKRISGEIRQVTQMGVQVCLVVGGGNIFRGVSGADQGIERTTGDHMGMLATLINALALQSTLESMDLPTRVLSAIPAPLICEPYIRRRAIRHLERGRIVIFAAGTGNPYFTTDTAAALRASEMECDLLLKGTKVDGIYSADPHKDPEAKRLTSVTFQDVLKNDLKVMDMAAFSLAKENNIPIAVFSILTPGALVDVVSGRGQYTLVHS
jgi:uridylate kinase